MGKSYTAVMVWLLAFTAVMVWLLAFFVWAEPQSAHQRGMDLYRQKAYAQAAVELEKAAREDRPGSPEWQESALALGQSYFVLAQAAQAILWLEKLPASTEANYMLGYAYLQTHQAQQAEAAFARLFGVRPDSAAGHLMAGQMMLKKDFDGEAAKEVQTALAMDSKLPEAHFLLGEIAIFRGRSTDGIAELEKELALNPNLAKAWYRLGDAYTRGNRWAEAIPNLQRAVWLNPEFSGPYILLGKCYLKQANYPNAEGILRRAVAIDPNNQAANYLLGQTLVAEGKREEGRAVLDKLSRNRMAADEHR